MPAIGGQHFSVGDYGVSHYSGTSEKDNLKEGTKEKISTHSRPQNVHFHVAIFREQPFYVLYSKRFSSGQARKWVCTKAAASAVGRQNC